MPITYFDALPIGWTSPVDKTQSDLRRSHQTLFKDIFLLTLEQIARRAAREARENDRVLISSELASLIQTFLPKLVEVVPAGNGFRNVDVAFFSLAEIARLEPPTRKTRTSNKRSNNNSNGKSIFAKRTIAIYTGSNNGDTDFTKLGFMIAKAGKRRAEFRLVTNAAVIDLDEKGIILREVAPGVSARDVQKSIGSALLTGFDLCEING